jgi:hypothetical protein
VCKDREKEKEVETQQLLECEYADVVHVQKSGMLMKKITTLRVCKKSSRD